MLRNKIIPIFLSFMFMGHIFANPIAKNAYFVIGDDRTETGHSLKPYVSGGIPPYVFMVEGVSYQNNAEIKIAKDGSIDITSRNHWIGSGIAFKYKVIDSTGSQSNIAQIFLHVEER